METRIFGTGSMRNFIGIRQNRQSNISGGTLLVWEYFNWWRVGQLVNIGGIMRKENHLNILQTELSEFIQELIFQQDCKSNRQNG